MLLEELYEAQVRNDTQLRKAHFVTSPSVALALVHEWQRFVTLAARPAPPFRVLVCATRTLNARGESRVTVSLRQEPIRAVCGPRQEERGLIK